MRVPVAEFEALDLEVHGVLHDVPLRDVSVVDLPGGGEGRSIDDVRALMSEITGGRASAPVRALFALRGALGRIFAWDRDPPGTRETASAFRLTEGQIARSKQVPGTRDGLFRLLFLFDNEVLGEIRNATVHAFSCMALIPRDDGYRLYWAIYVAPVSRLTGLYMAMIEPFRRYIVYPSILGRLRSAWIEADRNRASFDGSA